MENNDYLVKSMTKDGMFRAYAVRATNLVEKAHEIHDTWSASSAALGRTLIGTLLLSTSSLDEKAGMTVKIQGNGPVGYIVADGTAHGEVKGYMKNPHVNLPLNDAGKIDVAGAIGRQGTLSVTTMTPGDKTPYTGEVDLISGELGDDFTYYLAKSEQIPSAVGLSVFVEKDDSIKAAGGFMVQVMPGANDEAITKLETAIQGMPRVSDLLLEGKTPEDILHLLFPDEELKMLQTMPVSYACHCNKNRFAHALATIKPADLKEMIEQDEGAEIVCQFCGKKYQFDKQDLEVILKQATSSDQA